MFPSVRGLVLEQMVAGDQAHKPSEQADAAGLRRGRLETEEGTTSTDDIPVHCPHCQAHYSVAAADLGGQADCESCGKSFTLTQADIATDVTLVSRSSWPT